MISLQSLNLTEEDFKLMIDGLDALPERSLAGEMMVDLLSVSMAKDDKDALRKLKDERFAERRKRDREKDALREDIKILQGKLLMLKRMLLEQGALQQANEVLNRKS